MTSPVCSACAEMNSAGVPLFWATAFCDLLVPVANIVYVHGA